MFSTVYRCHGEGTNAVYQLARQYNLLQVAKVNYHRFDCIQSNGESVPTQLTDYLIVLIKGILKAAEVDFKNPNGISLGAYLSKRSCGISHICIFLNMLC